MKKRKVKKKKKKKKGGGGGYCELIRSFLTCEGKVSLCNYEPRCMMGHSKYRNYT